MVYALAWGLKHDKIAQVWDPIRREIHAVIDLISTRARLLDRLYELQQGARIFDRERDMLLAQAGLIRITNINDRPQALLRTSIIAEELRLEEQGLL